MKPALRTFLAILTLGFALPAWTESFAQSDSKETPAPEAVPLQVDRFPSYFYGDHPLTPEPTITLRFNAPVKFDDVRAAVVFTDRPKGERRIPVKVNRPSDEEIKELQPWGEGGSRMDLSAEHFATVTPLTPLPTGVAWRVRIDGSLKSADGTRALGSERHDDLGTLSPFQVNRIEGHNDYDSDRSIHVSLNKSFHDEITDEVLAGFISVTPEPDNLSIRKNYGSITLNGDFRYGIIYQVKVFSGLVAHDDTRLETESRTTVKFEPNPGFISLPAFSRTQNASGTQRFDILTGNLKGVRVRVKKLSDRDLVYAIRGYSELYGGHGDRREIPFEMVPGRTIYDREYQRTAEIDHSEKITLNWAEILQGEPHAALYICAEGSSETKQDFTVGAQSIIQLTDIGLAWKQDNEDMLAFAFSLKTGKPQANLDLELLDEEAEPLGEFKTDGNGLARLDRARLDRAKWLGATRGKDRQIVETPGRYDAVGLWQFSIPYRYEDETDLTERRTLLFTDRGLYKPGDTVHLKCLSRLTDGDQLLPVAQAAGRAMVKVTDSRGRTIFDQEVVLGDRGSFDVSFEVPEEKTLGWYSVEVDFSDPEKETDNDWKLRFRDGFLVAEYRPNTFEIDIDTESAKKETVDFRLPVAARYYMGKPLSKAQIAWHVSAYPTWPEVRGFDEFRFGDTINDREGFSASQTVHLSETGEARIDFTLPESESGPTPMRVAVRAEITDINQQTVAESASFVVDSSDYYIGMRNPDGIVRAGTAADLSLAALSPDGKAHEKAVDAIMLVQKREYHTVKIKGAGGRITNRTETELVRTLEQPVKFETRLQADTGLPLAAKIPLTLPEAGDYEVTITARDPGGREVRSRTLLQVVGADEPAWTWHDGIRIDVMPDKEKYRVGETAKLLVRSPVFGQALVTIERGDIRESRVMKITEHETVIEVPVGEGSAPNLFASVLIVRGSADSPHEHPNADYRLGYCQLMVDDPASNLTVSVEKPETPFQLPGAPVTVGARVVDHAGKPVRDAEVTLYAVDEGVLSLRGYSTPKPGEIFFEPYPLGVKTGQTLSDLLPENPNEQDFGNKGYVIGGGGEEDGLDPNRVRKNFQALAFWSGSLVTDAGGRVSTTFTAPDNLTTYRIMAVAAGGNRFGSAEDRLIINKPLILEPALPAFGNAGDLMDLSAVLHNNTDQAVELEVRVELDRHAEFLPDIEGLVPTRLKTTSEGDRPDLRVRRVTLAARETSKIGFPAVFTRMGEAVWQWKASDVTNPKLVDAVESKLQIGYPVPLLREARLVSMTEPGKAANLLEKVNPTLLNGRGTARVTLSNSRVIEALDALEYLLHYPYGCVEQTTSSTLPWLSTQLLREAVPQLKTSDAEIASAVNAGTRRLLSMQTSQGGLSYWPGGSEPMLWGSAYGGMALALAQRSGTVLPQERLNALWKYLSDQLRDSAKVTGSGDLYHRCLALYTLALAGKSEPAYHDVLFNKREQLSADARALLALAMMESAGAGRDASLDERLAALLPTAPEKAVENSNHWYRAHFSTAMELLAWSKWDALNKHTDELLDRLLGVPRGRHGWGSTYLSSWGLLAVAQHGSASASALSGTVCRVKFGDETREVKFGDKLNGELLKFDFEGDRREVPLEVRLDTSSRIFAHIEIESQPEIAPRVAENHGFAIERTYHRLMGDGGVEPIDELEVGDLVLITLHVSVPENEKFNYLALDDPLPSVFEAVNPEFKTQAGAGQGAFHGDWKRLYTNHTELRTDRALFFCDYLHKGGDYAVQYLARVVAPGEATAPPAKIEAMYEPQRYGLSSTVRVIAKPLDTAPKNRVAKN